MFAKELFEQISGYIQEAVNSQDSSAFVDRVKALNLKTEGEVNYMRPLQEHLNLQPKLSLGIF